MESVKGWAIVLCTAAVACAVLQLLAPKGGMGRIFKMLIAAFFLCCMLTPLLSLKSMLPLRMEQAPAELSAAVLQERVNEQLIRQMETALLRVTKETLHNYQIKVQKVAMETDTLEDGRISITKIILYLDKQNMKQAVGAKQIMEQRLGIPVVVQKAVE